MRYETAPISGRPKSATDEDTIHQVETNILEDRITICQLSQDVKISFGPVDKIFHAQLHMQKFSVRWVSSLLTPFKK